MEAVSGITPAGYVEIWQNSELLSDAGLRAGVASGTDVRTDGSGGLVEQQAEVLLSAGVGPEQLRLVCSVLQCCGLPYHPGSRLGVGPVDWENLRGPARRERVAVEARGSSIRARLLLSAMESLQARCSGEGPQGASSLRPTAKPRAQGRPETVERVSASFDDRNRPVQGEYFRPVRASHIAEARCRVTPYGRRIGLDASPLPHDYTEPICGTCNQNIASEVLGGLECWECYYLSNPYRA
jgi:hypothetical protein